MASIRATYNLWFMSYLNGRYKQVRVNDILRDVVEVIQRVPQGSVLDSVVFLDYIIELCQGSFRGQVNIFADDTALCYHHLYLK